MSTSKAGNLVITAADYYLGHHTAAYLIEHYRNKFDKIVLTAAHPDRLEHFRKDYVKVIKINPEDTSSYGNAFQGADWVLFFPEPESGRVQSANRAIDAMKISGANNVILMSWDSANSTKHRYLAEFKEIEEKLVSMMNNFVIIRSAVTQNLTHLQAPYVAKHQVFPLILSENVEFAPVNLDDEIDACVVIMKEGIEKHRAAKYHFTGPEMMTGPMIAHELTKAINSPKEITYKQISCFDMKKYLESLRDRMGEEDIANGHHDRLKYEFRGQPTEHQIHSCLEEMEWLEEGNSKKSEDLKWVLGRNGRSIDQFFGDHKKEFISH